jgi:signal transduction histidine kinase
MQFDMQEESLNELLESTIAANEAYAEKFNVLIDYNKLEEDHKVCVDKNRFSQVFSNLISNAAKFSPENETIDIRTETLASKVRISVRDQGPGIAPEFRGRIFNKFCQADSSFRRMKGGTGLGLHISKQLVEKMNGNIGFDTEIGVGTTFWVELPLAGAYSEEQDMTSRWKSMAPFLAVYSADPQSSIEVSRTLKQKTIANTRAATETDMILLASMEQCRAVFNPCYRT